MKKSFIQLSKAWYADANLKPEFDLVDEICVDFSNSEEAEIVFKWTMLNDKPCCKLEMFTDSWKAFKMVPELFQKLSNYPNDLSPSELVKVLEALGFENKTPTKR